MLFLFFCFQIKIPYGTQTPKVFLSLPGWFLQHSSGASGFVDIISSTEKAVQVCMPPIPSNPRGRNKKNRELPQKN